ncbi:MAG: hypothetical protein AAGU75_07800, partial [Bacillota bacterium]
RPKPITVIAWYLIIVYSFALVSIPMVLFIPTVRDTYEAMGTPVGLSLGFTFLSSAVMIFSGISILKGMKLGKYVTLVYIPSAMLVECLLNGFHGSVIVGIIIYIVIFYFLSRESAKKYFNHEWIEPVDLILETKESARAPVGGNVLVYERVEKGSVDRTLLTVDLQDTSGKQPSMARKAIGTTFFFFGNTTLVTYFTAILPVIMNLSQDQGMVAVGAIIFTVMVLFSGILILIGFLIWGFKHGRELITLGTFITGAWTVFGALGLITIQFMPQYRELQELQQNQDIDLTSMGLYMMIAGIINLIIAAFFSHEFKKFVSNHRKKFE